jgi:carboxyl-terminal processing protease
MHIDDVVRMVRGKKGTIVRLHVQHASGDKETIEITRDNVVVEETYARGAVLTKKGQFGYIHLPSFYGGKGPGQRTAAGDVGKLLREMKARKAKGVILDLRSNGGGLLGDAIEMSGEMIDKSPVVQVQDSRGRKQVLGDDHAGTDYDGPVIVLVNKFSASASEILAGAMQDYGRAIIVGEGAGTHGKGTVQTVVDLDQATGANLDLGVLKLTIEQFFRVSGASTQREGVTPDIVLPDPNAYIESGEKTLEHAIAWSQVPAAPHDQWAATWKTPALVASSAKRVASTPVFGKINALTTLLKARKADTKIPLQRTAWDAWRKKEKTEVEAVSPNLDKQAARFTVAAIDEPAKPDERLVKWKDGLARDPWVDECLAILNDMAK